MEAALMHPEIVVGVVPMVVRVVAAAIVVDGQYSFVI